MIDFQTAVLSYVSGAAMAFHTNLDVPDDHRRFCIMGTHGMAEGDFVRGYLRVTSRDGGRFAGHDYTKSAAAKGAHHGAYEMTAADVTAYLRRQIGTLPVSIIDAPEAGVAALALVSARVSGQMVDPGPVWTRLDSYGLRA